ncbi:MAG: Blue-light-activated protein [Verrucomicrobiales bacterium]|nr:Blue-light-activated protein [Verrucomicrobiales bacterium]
MNVAKPHTPTLAEAVTERAGKLYQEHHQNIIRHTDQLFGWLMICQWFFAVCLAIWISPLTWAGKESQVHPHVWVALLLGGVLTVFPVMLAFLQPGKTSTRHVIAIGQMLMSALLIHLTGGRIETHFHVFGSLAILAFYRDWRVMVSGSAIVYIDHLMRGFFWPQSVYGESNAPIWRSLEHAGWVVFEVTFLLISIQKSLGEMFLVAQRQAMIEFSKEEIEQTVTERTADLRREINQRRQVEAEVRSSQAQLAQAQQIARLGSWEWDLAANQVWWSDETKRLYGHKPEDEGSPMEICLLRVHPDDLPRVNEIMADSLRTGKSFVCDHRVKLPDGTERVIQGRAETIFDSSGKPVKMLGTVQDITEMKKAEEALLRSEEQLRQSQKMEAVGRLAGGVAHDFNNMLTVIGGYCELTLAQLEEGSVMKRHIIEIQNATGRAGALTGQLLAFSRRQVLQPRVLNLNVVVSGMEKMLRRLIGEDIDLSIAVDESLGNVKADRGQIEQVIMNLAVNGRDAMPRGGKLTIQTANATIEKMLITRDRTLKPGDYILLMVTDNGTGMTDEVKSHLFEPFFTTKGIGKGTGLGLATCYGIVCQSGGDILVESEVDAGATFKIYLPRTEAAGQELAGSELKKLEQGDESILVVEDEPAVRILTMVILRECGYNVQEARDGVEALHILRSQPPFDLVLTDVIMPRMSGKQLCDQIKLEMPKTKVLLMSGYTDDALAQHGVLEEGLSFLEKPFSPEQLTRKLREVLDLKVEKLANCKAGSL